MHLRDNDCQREIIRHFLLYTEGEFRVGCCYRRARYEINYLGFQLKTALIFVAENITTIRLEDPANTQNIISNNLTKEEKNRIRILASHASEAKNWNHVFFN